MQLSIADELNRKGIDTPIDENDDGADEDTSSFLENVGIALIAPLLSSAYIIGRTFERVGTFITGNASVKRALHERVENMRSSFSADEFLNGLIERKDQVINSIKGRILDDLISKLTEQIESILNSSKSREDQLASAENHLSELEVSLRELSKSMEETFTIEVV